MSTNARGTGRRLLIVIESEALLSEASRYSTDRGFRVHGTRSLEHAASLVAHLRYAVVLVHLERPSVRLRNRSERFDALLRHVARGTVVMLTTDGPRQPGRSRVSPDLDETAALAEAAQVVATVLSTILLNTTRDHTVGDRRVVALPAAPLAGRPA